MKAVVIHSLGKPEVLRVEEAAKPRAGQGEVLIRVQAASVNPVDYKIRSGQYKKADIKLPLILGRDVAGTVEDVGPGVTGHSVGEEVYAFLGSHSGGYAEFAVAKNEEVATKPKTLDAVKAAAVPLAAMTAWQALFDHGKMRAGERVLIHGAGGGVGHFAVQFAKAKGAYVIATASGQDIDLVKRLGADEVIDYKNERFEDKAHHIDLVIDLIGGDTQKRSWHVLKNGGRLISTLQEPSPQEAATHHALGKVFMAQPKADELREIAQLIDDGKVTVVVTKTLPLEAARQAHEEMENEHTQGKLVLTIAAPA